MRIGRNSDFIYIIFRTLFVAVAVGLLTFAGLFISSRNTEAYNELPSKCNYDTDSIDPITYRFFSIDDSSVETGFDDAVVDWNLSPAPGWFSEASTSLDPEINVRDGTIMYPYYAQMEHRCSSDGTFKSNEVTIRFEKSYNLTDHENRIISLHEIGHAYGLDHVTESCHAMTTNPEWNCSGSRPSSDDVDGVKFIFGIP